MSSGLTTGRHRGRVYWVVAAICTVPILVAGAYAWGGVKEWRDEREAAKVIEQFRDAINAADYETACSLLAPTAPPRRFGEARCPSRLRNRKSMIAEWAYILPGELVAEIEQRDDGHVHVIPREKSLTFLDAGPIYRFIFVEENGSLRIEHHLGRF